MRTHTSSSAARATKLRPPLHLAIDLRIVDAPGQETTGQARYALETTRALQTARPNWRFSLFSNRPELLCATATTTVLATRIPTEHALGRITWLHGAAAFAARRVRPDVWFSPSFVLPVWWRGRAVVTIHDLTFMLMRDRYRGRANAAYATAATRWSARSADLVLCPSDATRKLVVAHLGIDAAKVEVTPEGVADAFFAPPPPDTEHCPPLRSRPYLLFVGTWEARKGIGTLYAALRRVNAERERVRLVLAGQLGWGTGQMIEEIRRDPTVELCEKPTDDQLAALYRGALALVYPSEMEGFGLPVAEAMACGCPVIATELAPIREFADDVPLYLTAGDSGQLARHVEQLLSGARDLEARRERGREVAASLRWSDLGGQTATLIERLLAPVSPRASG
jgi:glycosyltransferase involved in cell wall biosynthesis